MRALAKRLRSFGLVCVMLVIVADARYGFVTLTQGRISEATHSSLSSTDGPNTTAQFVSEQPVTCESFAALIDNAAVEWLHQDGTYLIVIVRTGQGERSSIAKFRLKRIEKYLERYKSSRAVTAEGDRIQGLGRVELYVGGKLKTIIPVKRNSPTV